MSWTLDSYLPTLDASSAIATLDGNATIFSWVPSYSSPRKTKFNLRRAPFGDGYEQRSGVGINNIIRVWDLRFDTLSEESAQEILNFLESHSNGQSFDWIPPYLNPNLDIFKVTCDEFDINPSGYMIYDLTATFVQTYGE